MSKTLAKIKKQLHWLLPTLFFLLLATAIAMPLLSHITYADRADAPVHTMHYETGRLYWVEGTPDIDENGICHLSLFDALPRGEDGEKLISPGDEDMSVIRLRNTTGHEVNYSVVLYKISKSGVPVKADITNLGADSDTHSYTLPKGVTKSNVIRAVGGEISPYQSQDFDIEWIWEYHIDEESDMLDTFLGDLERADVTLGVYVVVTDDVEVVPAPGDVDYDVDGDGIPDINLDTDNDGEAEVNIDVDGDKIPDINIDVNGDKKADTRIDLNGDGIADFNIDSNGDGTPDINVIKLPVENDTVKVDKESTEKIFDKFKEIPDLTLKFDNLGEYIEGIELSRDAMEYFANHGIRLRLIYTNLRVEFDSTAMKALIAGATTDRIYIVAKAILKEELSTPQLAALENKQLALPVRCFVYSGNKPISDFGGGIATVYVPYRAYTDTKIEDYKFYYLTKDGSFEDIDDVYQNGFFYFNVEHFSEYVLIYEGDGDISGIPAEPPVCSCIICLFGDDCTKCELCWTFIVVVALVVISGIGLIIWRKFE